MQCPHCGSNQVKAISTIDTQSDIQGYGCCKGACGAMILGPIGWLCGLIGMGGGTSTSTTNILWVCESCGHKFK